MLLSVNYLIQPWGLFTLRTQESFIMNTCVIILRVRRIRFPITSIRSSINRMWGMQLKAVEGTAYEIESTNYLKKLSSWGLLVWFVSAAQVIRSHWLTLKEVFEWSIIGLTITKRKRQRYRLSFLFAATSIESAQIIYPSILLYFGQYCLALKFLKYIL